MSSPVYNQFIWSWRYNAEVLFSNLKKNIGKIPVLTPKVYAKGYHHYRRAMLSQGLDTPQIGAHRDAGMLPPHIQRPPSYTRAFTVEDEISLVMIGLMICPNGMFTALDIEQVNSLEHFIDMGNHSKEMDILCVYWCYNKYVYNWARKLLRSQRKGRTTGHQITGKLNAAVKVRAANLYGMINGKIADFRRDDTSDDSPDDPTDHLGSVNF